MKYYLLFAKTTVYFFSLMLSKYNIFLFHIFTSIENETYVIEKCEYSIVKTIIVLINMISLCFLIALESI